MSDVGGLPEALDGAAPVIPLAERDRWSNTVSLLMRDDADWRRWRKLAVARAEALLVETTRQFHAVERSLKSQLSP